MVRKGRNLGYTRAWTGTPEPVVVVSVAEAEVVEAVGFVAANKAAVVAEEGCFAEERFVEVHIAGAAAVVAEGEGHSLGEQLVEVHIAGAAAVVAEGEGHSLGEQLVEVHIAEVAAAAVEQERSDAAQAMAHGSGRAFVGNFVVVEKLPGFLGSTMLLAPPSEAILASARAEP